MEILKTTKVGNESLNEFSHHQCHSTTEPLSAEEQQSLLSILTNNLQRTSNNVLMKGLADDLRCPHCDADSRIVKNGKNRNGEQSYLCRACNRSFVAKRDTIFFGSHKSMQIWKKFLDCMVNLYSIRKTAAICDINTHTAFVWRHKVLDTLAKYSESGRLKGVVEADETFFRVSFKGQRDLPRPPKKRGTPMKYDGQLKERVCVACALDREDNKVSLVATLGNISAEMLHDIYDDRIVRGAVLCTDGFKAYKTYAEDNYGDIAHVVIDPERHKNGVYHINHINAYHSHMKTFIQGFRGVSTKYLQNYLEWYNALYAVSDEQRKTANMVNPVMAKGISEIWDDVSRRPALPLAA